MSAGRSSGKQHLHDVVLADDDLADLVHDPIP